MIGASGKGIQRGHVEAMIDALPSVERYSGVTNASGDYTVVYAQQKAATPAVLPILTPPTANNINFRLTASTATGFTVKVEQRSSIDLLGSDVLLSSVSNASGRNVEVIVIEF